MHFAKNINNNITMDVLSKNVMYKGGKISAIKAVI